MTLALSMHDRLNKDYASYMEIFAEPLAPVALLQTLDEYLAKLPVQLDGTSCI